MVCAAVAKRPQHDNSSRHRVDPGTGASTPMGKWDDPTNAVGTVDDLPNWNIDFTERPATAAPARPTRRIRRLRAGTLTGYSVAKDGIVKGNYSNGQTKILAQVVLTTFPTPTA